MKNLNAHTSGRWEVLTETARYLVDLDLRTVIREPGAGAGARSGLPAPPISRFPTDHATLRLLDLVDCRVGQPMILWITPSTGPAHPFWRVSTTVRGIRALPAHPDDRHAGDDRPTPGLAGLPDPPGEPLGPPEPRRGQPKPTRRHD